MVNGDINIRKIYADIFVVIEYWALVSGFQQATSTKWETQSGCIISSEVKDEYQSGIMGISKGPRTIIGRTSFVLPRTLVESIVVRKLPCEVPPSD